MDTDAYIELSDGSKYYPNEPFDWKVDTMAHALGNQCRYTGHCRHFYSVAEHSVLCSLLSEELGLGDPFEALMHDAHESVITDMASPWKPHLPDYVAAERQAEESLRSQFNLPLQMSDEAKQIDMLALFIEAHYLIPSKGQDWQDPLGVRVRAMKLVKEGWRVQGLDPEMAKNAFLRRYHALAKNRPEPWWKQLDADENGQRTLLS